MHFLAAAVRRRELKHFVLGQAHAAILARVEGKEKVLTIDGGILIAKHDVQWLALPEEWKIVGPDGKAIRSSGTFLVTVESFDPCHMVADVRDELVPHYYRRKRR